MDPVRASVVIFLKAFSQRVEMKYPVSLCKGEIADAEWISGFSRSH